MSEDVVTTRRFFQNNIEYEERKEPLKSVSSPAKLAKEIADDSNPIDFYSFYNQAIKTRVQQKLEEEEEKKAPKYYPPAVSINLDDDEDHPPGIPASESPPSHPDNIEATPPRKLPRRRPAANLSSL